MAEAKRKSRKGSDVVAAETRCIYCAAPATTLEHMPPRGMFRGRQRPGAMEFGACEACNNGTRGADAVAAVFSRLHPDQGVGTWQQAEIKNLIPRARRLCSRRQGGNERTGESRPTMGPAIRVGISSARSPGPCEWPQG
jgi:hypothetical protein